MSRSPSPSLDYEEQAEEDTVDAHTALSNSSSLTSVNEQK